MTLERRELDSSVSIHVARQICFKWKIHEIEDKSLSKPGGFVCHLRSFFNDMVDCLNKVGHSAKRSFSIKQHDNRCYSSLKLDGEHLCSKSQNSIMQKSHQGVEPSTYKPSDLSLSVEHGYVEKGERHQNVWQRRDSLSSCSSDSAVCCSMRHTQVSIPDEPVRILTCENSHIDMTCESKRQRHSSGSSVISIASDASCKEPPSGSGRKNLSCLGASSRISEADPFDIGENAFLINQAKKAKPNLVNISKRKQEAVEENSPSDAQKKKACHSSPPAVRFHDLRKNIRRKACCHGDCNETHTTFIVRRYTENHNSNNAHQHSSSAAHQHSSSDTCSLSRSVQSSSTSSSSVDSSPNSNKKRRSRSEIDKLFAALHEIKWARHFSPETILQQTEARRTSCSAKLLNTADSPSVPRLLSSPPSKNRVSVKSRSPTKNATTRSILSEKEAKPQESFTLRNRPSIHFLNTNSEVTKASPPRITHRGSWLSTKKKVAEKHSYQRKTTVLSRDTVACHRPEYAEVSDVEDNVEAIESCSDDSKGKHPIFLQVAGSIEDRTSTPKKQRHLENSENLHTVDSDPNMQCSSVEHLSDIGSDTFPSNAQSAVIDVNDSVHFQVQVCELQDCNSSLEHLKQDVNKSKGKPLTADKTALIISSSEATSSPSDLSPCEKQRNDPAQLQSSETLVSEDQSYDISGSTGTDNPSCHNESLELPLLSSEDSPVKDAPFSETPPVLEPCIALPPVEYKLSSSSDLPCVSHTSAHVPENSTAVQESDSERSRASSPEVLFSTPVKQCKSEAQSCEEDFNMIEDQLNKQPVADLEFCSSPCSLKELSCGARSEDKTCDASSSKRASRLILKKYMKNSNKKKHKRKKVSWSEDDGKAWSCVVVEDDPEQESSSVMVEDDPGQESSSVVVEGDQQCNSDEVNQLPELLNHKFLSPVASTDSVNNSSSENGSHANMKPHVSAETNCKYSKDNLCDGAFSTFSNKSKSGLSSSSYVVHVKNVAHSSTTITASQNSVFEGTVKKHGKYGKTLHLKEKGSCKKSKKTPVTGGTTNGNNSMHEERRELPQEVIKLRMLYGFTFHYKGITVNKNDSYTQVILKLTTSRNIFLSVEALMELKDTLNSAGSDSNCQVLIINGIGNSFCSGLDLRPLMGPRKKDAAREMAVAVKEFIEALASFHKPLVSVVNGSAVGLGVTLLTYSDVVLASDTASFHMPYSQLGYMPEGAVCLTLPQVMGSTVATDMLLRGRKITAHQARDHGLVSEVLEAKKLPQQLVSRVRILAESPVSAMESAKSMLRWHLYGKLHVALENEVQILPKQWLSPPCQAALRNAFQTGLLGE